MDYSSIDMHEAVRRKGNVFAIACVCHCMCLPFSLAASTSLSSYSKICSLITLKMLFNDHVIRSYCSGWDMYYDV